MSKLEERFELHDGGHCYLRARMLQSYVVIERWPARASLSDIVQLGDWARANRRPPAGLSMQSQVGAWCAETFKDQPLEGVFAHLWEELHEVFENCSDEESREEAADVGLIVMEIAHKLDIALQRPQRLFQKQPAHLAEIICDEFEEEMRLKFEVCKQAKWSMDAQGVYHREKESNG